MTVYNLESDHFGRAFFVDWLEWSRSPSVHASSWLHMLPEYNEGLPKEISDRGARLACYSDSR